eukprot:scaffold24117_cov31-Tisochrysis_lutea.AAC.2
MERSVPRGSRRVARCHCPADGPPQCCARWLLPVCEVEDAARGPSLEVPWREAQSRRLPLSR